jgi:hypothetical protein
MQGITASAQGAGATESNKNYINGSNSMMQDNLNNCLRSTQAQAQLQKTTEPLQRVDTAVTIPE